MKGGKMNKYMLMNEKSEADAGGGKKQVPPTPPPPKDNAPPKEAGDTLDEYGYDKPKDEVPKDQKPAPKGEEDSEGEAPPTGYEKEPEKLEPPKDDKPKDSPPPEDDLKLDPKGLADEDVKNVKEFAKKHKISKEVAQALLDERKAAFDKAVKTLADQQAEEEADIKRTKIEWYKELKNDATFGGDKFEHNIKQIGKVVDDFMPNLKKVLTERKVMMPPYIMKDLAKIAGHLYSTDKMIQGDPPAPSKKDEPEDDSLAFYNS
jgi:outer membrane protein OmpA-like peptidoglycan-associated protein